LQHSIIGQPNQAVPVLKRKHRQKGYLRSTECRTANDLPHIAAGRRFFCGGLPVPLDRYIGLYVKIRIEAVGLCNSSQLANGFVAGTNVTDGHVPDVRVVEQGSGTGNTQFLEFWR
jgi:hypothetical protein